MLFGAKTAFKAPHLSSYCPGGKVGKRWENIKGNINDYSFPLFKDLLLFKSGQSDITMSDIYLFFRNFLFKV